MKIEHNTRMDNSENEKVYLNEADLPNSDLLLFHENYYKSKSSFNFFIENCCLSKQLPLKTFLDQIERLIVMKALVKCNGNQRKTAQLLGIKYTTLNEKVKRHNIQFRKTPL